MGKENEDALELAETLNYKIRKLHQSVEYHFEELSLGQIEDKLADAGEYFEELESLHGEFPIVEDDYISARGMVEELEGWLNEKEDLLKTEGDN
jgi:hypothetical protein